VRDAEETAPSQRSRFEERKQFSSAGAGDAQTLGARAFDDLYLSLSGHVCLYFGQGKAAEMPRVLDTCGSNLSPAGIRFSRR
jgi:hypothetical protein